MKRTETVEIGHYKVLILRILSAAPGNSYSYSELKRMTRCKSLATVTVSSRALIEKGFVEARYVKKSDHYSDRNLPEITGNLSIRVLSAKEGVLIKYLDSFINFGDDEDGGFGCDE